MRPPTNHFVVVVDIEDFSQRSDPVQRSLRRAMYEVLRTAVDDAHLAWADFHPQDRGDGVIMLVESHVSPVSLAGELVRALELGLLEKSVMYSADHKMRLRVALHQGLASPDDEGWSGDAINTACRLVNAQLLRETLVEARRAQVALIVSDSFYQSVIRPGHRSIDPATFSRVTVTIKNLVDFPAWVQVPGYATPPNLPRTKHARTAPPTRPSEEPGPSGNSGVFINGNVGGDVVNRDKHVYYQR
jgi:class 3 adenylate cyclase